MYAGIEQVMLGDLLREWNDLEAASRHLEEGLRLAEFGGDFVFVRDSYLARARLEQAKGNFDDALNFIHKAESIAQRTMTLHDRILVDVGRVRVWLAQGNLAAAEHWAQTHDLEWAAPLNFLNECALLAWARVLMARGQVGEAEQLLEQLLASAESGGRMGRVIEILVLQALAADVRHDLAGAVVPLNRALALAEPEGYVRLFVDEGVPMAALLDRAALNRSVRLGYIGKLLAAFGPATRLKASPIDKLSSVMRDAAAIAQPLSQREIEILHRLASGLSAKQIAQELIVSIGTVKTHTKSIYRKLDVHSRLQAVERARELRLI